MRIPNVQPNIRSLIVVACLIGALSVRTALANCPPGYSSKAGHCIPGPVHTHHPVAIQSGMHAPTAVSPVHASSPHAYAHVSGAASVHAVKPYRAVPKAVYASHSTRHAEPAPAASSFKYDLGAQHEAKSETHGIIFVGGKSALNPQPIPPGHLKTPTPNPGAPIERPLGH